MNIKHRLTRLAFAFAILNFSNFGIAQTDFPPQLIKPLQLINQRSVTATISFLAADELAGRDTPSSELNIASAYVASRFQGAGLQGGGERETYYQSTEIATIRLPQTGITANQDGKPIQHFGLLGGGAKHFSFRGKLTSVSHDDKFRRLKFNGPVYFDPGEIKDQRGVSNLTRQTNLLKRNGATAILIPVESQHLLVAIAEKARSPRLVQPRGGFAGPTLLVAPIASEGQFEIEIPKVSGGQATVKNVIGILPGSDPELKQEAIIFTAHLDHLGQTSGPGDTIYNGADDDASGVTAVLTLADAFTSLPNPPKRTLIFMTFWGEEKGLLGSRYYAKHPVWPLDKTMANINIEMIGRPEPGSHEKCWMTGWQQSDLGTLMNEGAQTVGIHIFEHPQFSSMLYRSSDNYSLVEKGVIAHSFSAGSLHSDYHQVTDEWKRLNLEHMTRVIQGLFAGALPLANGESTPKKSK